ncbi:neuritin-like protein [Salvelinus namaycush]|uniref:Neuritin-like protein n=1 Tax=Salvelinus namaycush TaxID=8040 RepID=A0A8U0PH69_SALNM|nr:neuritin-like protein [Salvelinus namaycush]
MGLAHVCWAVALPSSCGVIYKSFAQCLLTLGDSLGDTQKEQSKQDIDTVCSCPGDAAAVWESLRQESRKTQFSGNLYDMCASRTTLAPNTVPVPPSQRPPTSDQTNQETLKGYTHHLGPAYTPLLLSACISLLLLLRM